MVERADILSSADNRDQAYLTPNFLFSGFVPSSESEDSYSKENGAVQSANISPEAQLSLLLEMQPIWRELAAQLEECSVLEKRNVLSIFETSTTSMGEDAASALPAMQERLQKFRVEEQAQTLKEFAGLEKRFTGFLASYTDYVSASPTQAFETSLTKALYAAGRLDEPIVRTVGPSAAGHGEASLQSRAAAQETSRGRRIMTSI